MTKITFKISQILCVFLSAFFVLLFISCATTSGTKKLQEAEVHYKLGLSYFSKDELREALGEFQKALKLNPKHKASLYAIGLILMNREFEEYENAIGYFKRAVSVDPDYSEALNNIGVVYVKMEKWDKAIKYFRLALKNKLYTNPKSAYSNLGFAFYKKGDYKNAVDTLKKVISRYPDFPQYYYTLGLVYMETGKSRAAISEFKKAVEIEPRYIDTHWELANAYLRVGDTKKAGEHFKIIAESDGENERGQEALKYLELLKK